jgi:hypothetical protein
MINDFIIDHWQYIPLVVVLLLLYWGYRIFLKRFKYKRMVLSVITQKRVNLSPWTNFYLLIGTVLFLAVLIGLLWSGLGMILTLEYSLGFYAIFLLCEYLRRKYFGENTSFIIKIMGSVGFVVAFVVIFQIAYKTPGEELAAPTLDLVFQMSNDSYEKAPVNDSPADDLAVIRAVAEIGGQEYALGVFSDKTRRDQSFNNEFLQKYFKGSQTGWSGNGVDLTPYMTVKDWEQELTIKFQYDSGADCGHLTNVGLLINKIKGLGPSNYQLESITDTCEADKAQGKWLVYKFNLK